MALGKQPNQRRGPEVYVSKKPPYYVMPGERLQELLERASKGEAPGVLMAEEYEKGSKDQVAPDELYLSAYAVWMAFLVDEWLPTGCELHATLAHLSGVMAEREGLEANES